MNGYDAQDMASQGADGFRNGYQAGYADAVNAIEAAQPAAAQEAVAWQVGDEFYPSESLAIEAIQQWGPSDAIAIPLYAAASVTAAPVEVIRDDDGEIVMVKQGGKIIASTCHAGGKSPAAPGIDLREIGEAMAQAEQHVETLHSLCSRPSVLACIKRLRKAQASLIDSGPKGALPTLPDDFSESKDWRAGSYGERVVWLMDTVRSQREHIAALLGSPKGATLNEQFGSAEGLGDLPGMWEKADLVGGATDSEDGPKGGREADDAALLNWMDANGFTAYRSVDPIDGISGHCVVVHETMAPRRGNVHDTIRGAIRAAMKAQASDAEVQP